jgi:hypothetical protein
MYDFCMRLDISTEFNVHAISKKIVSITSNCLPRRKFRPHQKEYAYWTVRYILERRPEELTALFSRQSGKTETLSRVVVILMIVLPYLAEIYPMQLGDFKDGFWCGIFAPIKDQAKTAFDRAVGMFESQPVQAVMNSMGVDILVENETTRTLSNGSILFVKSASPGSNIEGASLHLAILEESQDIGYYKIRKSIEPMLTETVGLLVHVGTANARNSVFLEAINRNRKRQKKNPSLKVHFEYKWRDIIKFSSNYKRYLEHKFEQRGAQWSRSDEFRMGYELIFMAQYTKFITMNRYEELEKLGEYFGVGVFDVPTFFGIDWGKAADSTVVTAVGKFENHLRIIGWLELRGDDYEDQIPAICDFINKFKKRRLVLAESNGVGDPNVDRLKRLYKKKRLKCPVKGFFTTESSKSDGYKLLRLEMVQSNRLLFPADAATRDTMEYKAFADQATDLEKEYKRSLLKCSHPDTPDAHDDYMDSLMLATWAAHRENTFNDMMENYYGQRKTG